MFQKWHQEQNWLDSIHQRIAQLNRVQQMTRGAGVGHNMAGSSVDQGHVRTELVSNRLQHRIFPVVDDKGTFYYTFSEVLNLIAYQSWVDGFNPSPANAFLDSTADWKGEIETLLTQAERLNHGGQRFHG